MSRGAVVACWLALASTSARAIQMTLDRRAIEEVAFIGQSRLDAERARFHAPYRVAVARPPVDWIDVITPLHRVELGAEMKARSGSRQFGQQEARQILSEAPDQIDLLVEMTFHPLNTFVAVPSYEVVLTGSGGTRVSPRRLDRIPRFGPRLEPAWPALPLGSGTSAVGNGAPVLGGTLIAAFDGTTLEPNGRYAALVTDGTREIARVELDLATMR